MTHKQWVAKFLANKNLFCDLIILYHPAKVSKEQIEQAIVSCDYKYLYYVLSQTCFEIPESTEMHSPVFEMLYSMLDNPAEEL